MTFWIDSLRFLSERSISDNALYLAVAGSIGAFLWVQLRSRVNKKTWKLAPGWVPILGHIHKIPLPTVRNLPTTMEEWSAQYGTEDGCFEVDLAGKLFLVICREDRLQEILKSRQPGTIERVDVLRETSSSIGANGVFSAIGQEWVKERKIVSSAFNHNNLREYFSAQQEMTNRLVQKWNKIIAEQGDDKGEAVYTVSADVTRMASDTIAKVSFGKDFDFINSPDSQISSDLCHMFDMGVTRALSPIWYWRWPIIGQYLDGVGFAIDRVSKIIENVVEEEQANLAAMDPQHTPESTGKSNFLQKWLMNMKKEGTKLTRDRLVGNVITLFLAGTDTTGGTLSSGLFLLSKDQALQESLRNEVGNIDLDNISMDDLLLRFPRVKSFMHEVHRHYSLPFLWLETRKDVPFADTTLKPGTKIMLMTRFFNTSKDQPSSKVPCPNGRKPHEFDPERYLVRGEGGKDQQDGTLSCPTPPSSSGYGAFGYGSRACPGRAYGDHLSLLTLCKLLQSFDFEFVPSSNKTAEDVTFVYDGTMIPDAPVQLRLKARK